MYVDKTIELRIIIGIRMTQTSKFAGISIIGNPALIGSPPLLLAAKAMNSMFGLARVMANQMMMKYDSSVGNCQALIAT